MGTEIEMEIQSEITKNILSPKISQEKPLSNEIMKYNIMNQFAILQHLYTALKCHFNA